MFERADENNKQEEPTIDTPVTITMPAMPTKKDLLLASPSVVNPAATPPQETPKETILEISASKKGFLEKSKLLEKSLLKRCKQQNQDKNGAIVNFFASLNSTKSQNTTDEKKIHIENNTINMWTKLLKLQQAIQNKFCQKSHSHEQAIYEQLLTHKLILAATFEDEYNGLLAKKTSTPSWYNFNKKIKIFASTIEASTNLLNSATEKEYTDNIKKLFKATETLRNEIEGSYYLRKEYTKTMSAFSTGLFLLGGGLWLGMAISFAYPDTGTASILMGAVGTILVCCTGKYHKEALKKEKEYLKETSPTKESFDIGESVKKLSLNSESFFSKEEQKTTPVSSLTPLLRI